MGKKKYLVRYICNLEDEIFEIEGYEKKNLHKEIKNLKVSYGPFRNLKDILRV